MRVFRILGTLLVLAGFLLFIFTDRGRAAMLLLVAGIGLVVTDQRRARGDQFR
jgi:membrane-bound ClpP family serine protease